MNHKGMFLLIIGGYFLLSSSLMSYTGYWESLVEFKVSQKVFYLFEYFGFFLGGVMVVASLLHRKRYESQSNTSRYNVERFSR